MTRTGSSGIGAPDQPSNAKIAHFVRRAWGGRQARTRGLDRIRTHALTRAGALNLARLGVLGLRPAPTGWALA